MNHTHSSKHLSDAIGKAYDINGAADIEKNPDSEYCPERQFQMFIMKFNGAGVNILNILARMLRMFTPAPLNFMINI